MVISETDYCGSRRGKVEQDKRGIYLLDAVKNLSFGLISSFICAALLLLDSVKQGPLLDYGAG
jgi:hypothetical protein